MSIISIDQAVSALTAGELVAIPTETVYGLAGRIDREETLKKIFTVKSRPFFDPLIVHVSELAQAKSLTREWPQLYDLLAQNFWPGPLTLIAPKNDLVSSLITAGLDSVGLRSPAHPLAREIIRRVGTPLAAPSANRFGRTSPTKAEHVETEFQGMISVVDGGACDVGVESTVLRASNSLGKWQIEILRPGGISPKQIRNLLDRRQISYTIGRAHSNASPGHTKAHYQPESPVVIINKRYDETEILSLVCDRLEQNFTSIVRLPLEGEPSQAARTLYQQLRDLSRKNAVIVIEKSEFHASEDWQMVWDRVERAAILHL